MTATDPTYIALLRGVLTDRDDDGVRLVMADWVEENGEPERAAMIRAAITEERLRHTHRHGCGGCPKCKAARVVCRWIERHGAPSFAAGNVWYGGRGLSWDGGAVEYSRGFISHVSLSAAEWLRVEDSVYWHPEQERCPGCKGTGGRVYTGSVWDRFTCRSCDGTGRASREMPATAQPLTAVTIPNVPLDHQNWPHVSFVGGHSFTCPRWPGITFTRTAAS